MMRYVVDDLQAVEPDALTEADGIVVTVSDELDSMGFNRVAVEGPSAEAVVEYVRENWGDEDPEWFQEWVVDRVFPVPPALPRNYIANVIGEGLVDAAMPVESNPTPVRPSGDEGLLVLYGDPETGVTVVVAGEDEDDAERRIIATFGDSCHIDCVDASVDQRPLSVMVTAGLVADEDLARRLLAEADYAARVETGTTNDSPTEGGEWQYTIRVGFGSLSEGHDAICVWQIVGDDRERLIEGMADDIPDAITKVAQALLAVHDEDA